MIEIDTLSVLQSNFDNFSINYFWDNFTSMIGIIYTLLGSIITLFPTFFTLRYYQKLAVYNKKKSEFEAFTKVCGKYCGIASILTSVLKSTEKQSKHNFYADEKIKKMVEYKWEILSYFSDESLSILQDKMTEFESVAEGLRVAIVMQNLYISDRNIIKDPTSVDYKNTIKKLNDKQDEIYDVLKPKSLSLLNEIQDKLFIKKRELSEQLDNFNRSFHKLSSKSRK